jgi:hypothetical protein
MIDREPTTGVPESGSGSREMAAIAVLLVLALLVFFVVQAGVFSGGADSHPGVNVNPPSGQAGAPGD